MAAIDSAYGVNGSSTPAYINANAAAIQSDGKIVVAGSAVVGSRTRFLIVRYTIDGDIRLFIW